MLIKQKATPYTKLIRVALLLTRAFFASKIFSCYSSSSAKEQSFSFFPRMNTYRWIFLAFPFLLFPCSFVFSLLPFSLLLFSFLPLSLFSFSLIYFTPVRYSSSTLGRAFFVHWCVPSIRNSMVREQTFDASFSAMFTACDGIIFSRDTREYDCFVHYSFFEHFYAIIS